MGAKYYATVVYGFIITSTQQYATVTKFNENNGKPYQSKQKAALLLTIQGEDLEEKLSKKILSANEGGLKYQDMKFYHTTAENSTVLGVALVESEDINYEQYPQEFKLFIPPAVAKFATVHGLTAEYYLVSACNF